MLKYANICTIRRVRFINKLQKYSNTMKRDRVLAIVEKHREHLQTMGVKSLDLFGSVARNEARVNSYDQHD